MSSAADRKGCCFVQRTQDARLPGHPDRRGQRPEGADQGDAYPKTTVQTCIVHLIRNSLEYASYKDRKGLAAALRPIYAAAGEDAAREALQDFADGPWGEKNPTIVQSWQRAWEHVVPPHIPAGDS